MNEMLKKVAKKYAELYIKAGVVLTIGLAKVLDPARKVMSKINEKEEQLLSDFEKVIDMRNSHNTSEPIKEKNIEPTVAVQLFDTSWDQVVGKTNKLINSYNPAGKAYKNIPNPGEWFQNFFTRAKERSEFYEPEPTAADLQKLDMMIEGLKTEGLFKGFELLDLTGPRTEDATDEITDVNGELAKYPTMQSYGTTDNDIARGITGKNIDGLYIPTGVSNPGYTIPSQEINAWKDDQRNKEVAKTTNSPFGYCDPMKMAEFVLEKGKEVAVKAKAKTKNSAHKNKSTKKNKSKSKTFTKKTKSTKKAKK